MKSNSTTFLIIAAMLGGSVVQTTLQACGIVGTPPSDAAPEGGTAAPTPVITDWKAYTPILTSSAAGALVGNQISSGTWRRVGDTLEVRTITTFSGPPTGSGCNDIWLWSLPEGLRVSSTKIPYEHPSLTVTAGAGDAYQPGSGHHKLTTYVMHYNSIVATGQPDCYANANAPLSFGSNGFVELNISVPIEGWSAVE